MAGLLGKAVMNGTMVRVGQIPGEPSSGSCSAVNVVLSNNTATEQTLKVWISNSASAPADVDLVAPKLVIPAYGTAEVAARLCTSGEFIYVQGPAGTMARVECTPLEDSNA